MWSCCGGHDGVSAQRKLSQIRVSVAMWVLDFTPLLAIYDFILLSGLAAFPGRKPEDKPEGQCPRKETGRLTKVKPEDKPEGE